MKAALFEDFGGPDQVQVREVATPRPADDEVLLRVEAAGFNHLDLWVRRGLPIETTMPHIGGSDIVGRIVAVGEDVDGWNTGTSVIVNPALSCGSCRFCRAGETVYCARFRILGEHTNGGFAEYVAVPATNIYPLPPNISAIDGACLPVSYQTAWRALISRARIRPATSVLIIGASGGTAIAALQIALAAGARVFAVTSGEENVERVRALGAHTVYDRLSEDFGKALARDTDRRGVDVVVENVGEPTWESSIRSLATGGRLVTYGATAGPRVQIDVRRLFWKQIEIVGTTMATRGEFEDMLEAAASGMFAPVVDRVIHLSEAAEGHAYLEAGGHFGKVIVTPDG